MTTERWLIATGNRHKVQEIGAILREVDIELIAPSEVFPRPDPEECGTTFAANALIKAVAWAREHGRVAIADDSGLSVDALDGRPGVYSSRFAGDDATDAENNTHLLELLEGREDRRAAFHCVIAVAEPGMPEDSRLRPRASDASRIHRVDDMPMVGARVWVEGGQTFTVTTFCGQLIGNIAHEAVGSQGFGYDPLFVTAEGRRMAELAPDEKNAISHRSIALEGLAFGLASPGEKV